jgi:hypothetical protein
MYAASTMLCVSASLSQNGPPGEPRISEWWL